MSATKPKRKSTDLVLTRVFDAPRELVFKAWTDPKHLAQWFGPHGFTNPVCEVDLAARRRVAAHVMRGPDGSDYPMTVIFQEVVPPERLVFMSYVPDQRKPLFEILNTVDVSPSKAARRSSPLEAKVLKSTPEAAPMLAGMEEGWTQSLDRLAKHLAKA
jgi:uncharacterized protein YndB with AHSA1/START domain